MSRVTWSTLEFTLLTQRHSLFLLLCLLKGSMSSTCVLYHEGALHLPMICPLRSWLSLLVGEILNCTTPEGSVFT